MINKKIKTLDITKIDPVELEKSAIEAQRRFEEWRWKKETGNLTEQEKIAIENDKKLSKWLKTHDFFELKKGDLQKIFDTPLEEIK